MGSPSEKVDLALQVCREELGINSDLQQVDVTTSPHTFKLSSFLNQLRYRFVHHCKAETFQNAAPETNKRLKGKLNSGVKEQRSVRKQLRTDSSDYQRHRKTKAELRSEIDYYENKKLVLEGKIQQFHTEYSSEFDARKVDLNGNYIENCRNRSPCDYLNQRNVGSAKDYGYHTSGASFQSNRDTETELPVSQLPIGAFPKTQYNLLEETSVFGSSDKWRTPSSHELQSANLMEGKFSGISEAKQKLAEIKRHLELLKLMYLCHTERDCNSSVETRLGNTLSHTARDLSNSDFLSEGFPHSQPPSYGFQNTVTNSNCDKIFIEVRATPNTKPLLTSGDILNMSYPPVSMRQRPRSADSLSPRRSHSASSRPRSANPSVSYASSSSTSYRKSPDVLNRIDTVSKSNADLPVAGYIEASESQLFLPRSRPLGINDPISARTKTKTLTKGKFSTPRTASTGTSANTVLTTEKVFSESHTQNYTTEYDLDAISHLDDEFIAGSVSVEEHGAIFLPGSRPSSRAGSEDRKKDCVVDEGERLSQPPKLHGLTALIRMTAKKASG